MTRTERYFFRAGMLFCIFAAGYFLLHSLIVSPPRYPSPTGCTEITFQPAQGWSYSGDGTWHTPDDDLIGYANYEDSRIWNNDYCTDINTDY